MAPGAWGVPLQANSAKESRAFKAERIRPSEPDLRAWVRFIAM
jgi:hypothetical protein